MKKYFLLFLICYTPCFASAQGKCSNIFDNPPVYKGELIKEDGKPDKHFLGSGWTAKVYLIDGKEIGVNKKVIEKIYSPANFTIMEKHPTYRPNALRDLQLLRAFKEANIEELIVPDILKIKATLTNTTEKPSYFIEYTTDMDLETLMDEEIKRITVYLEYYEGTDLETLWVNDQLNASTIKEYNNLVKRVATYLKSQGNKVRIESHKAYENLTLKKTELKKIIPSKPVTIGNIQEDLMFRPSNVLLTKKGFVLIDPF